MCPLLPDQGSLRENNRELSGKRLLHNKTAADPKRQEDKPGEREESVQPLPPTSPMPPPSWGNNLAPAISSFFLLSLYFFGHMLENGVWDSDMCQLCVSPRKSASSVRPIHHLQQQMVVMPSIKAP